MITYQKVPRSLLVVTTHYLYTVSSFLFKDQFTNLFMRLRHDIRTPIYLFLQINSHVLGLRFQGSCEQIILFILERFVKTVSPSKELTKFISKYVTAKYLIPLIKCKLHRGRALSVLLYLQQTTYKHKRIYIQKCTYRNVKKNLYQNYS